ncbi:MAG: hypothetical protein ABIN36_00740 [Ferruginibacter sp.]
MKKLIFTTVTLTCFFGFRSGAQDVIRQVACTNEFINRQADSIKEGFSKQGYVIVKEASMTMESEYEMPIIVPLTQGSWYQFVFIGDNSSRLFEVRMYDYNERQVAYEKNLGSDVDGNIVSYRYIPQSTEFHMIKPVQVNRKKKKGLCGYVMLFKRVR